MEDKLVKRVLLTLPFAATDMGTRGFISALLITGVSCGGRRAGHTESQCNDNDRQHHFHIVIKYVNMSKVIS